MIIVSQNKKEIVNLDTISIIYTDYSDEYYRVICTDIRGCNLLILGEYKTEERAKEVLQEIIKTFSYIQLSGTYEEARLKMEITKLGRYEMPKE